MSKEQQVTEFWEELFMNAWKRKEQEYANHPSLPEFLKNFNNGEPLTLDTKDLKTPQH